MTTICWQGRTVAADRQADSAGTRRTATKIRRIERGTFEGGIFGGAGDHARLREMFEWISDGAIPAMLPKFQTVADDSVIALVLRKDGTAWLYGETAYPYPVEDEYHAMGSGREFSLAAMYCGKTAAEAVEVANIFDVYSGNGVDVLSLEE